VKLMMRIATIIDDVVSRAHREHAGESQAKAGNGGVR
jgi:hypothetical protein